MTAILKAFDKDVDDVEDVMNKLVVVGNNFPISVSQLAEGMNNAGSMLAVAGNSFEESVALLTASNATVQNISKASTGLRTIAARIRKMDTEDGEILEESKYNEMIDALTRHNVKLVDANGEYRKTYDIIKDIAAVWKDMNSMQQSAVVEALAGTRQQNIFASLMTQFGEAEEAVERMNDSTGELSETYGIYLDSIEAHTKRLQAAFDELSMDFVNSDPAKAAVDILTKVVEVLDTLVEKVGVVNTALATVAGGAFFKLLVSGKIASALAGLSGAFAALKAEATLAGVSTFTAMLAAIPAWVAPAIAAVAALTAAVVLYNQTIGKMPTFNDLKKEAKEAEEEFQDLRKEIEKNSDRIEELNTLKAKGDWTPELQSELTELQNQNAELEAQLNLLRDIAQYKAERLEAITGTKIQRWLSVGQTSMGDNNTFLMGQAQNVRSTEGYGGMLNDLEDLKALQDQLEENKEKTAKKEWDNEIEANQLRNERIELLDKIAEKESKLLETRRLLTEYRGYLAGSFDETSIEMIAQLNEVIEELDTRMGEAPKTFDDFKKDLKGLSDKVLKNFLSGVNLTTDELKDFKKWLDNCGYSAQNATDFFSQYVNELNAPQEVGKDTATAQRITELVSLQDELADTVIALNEYEEAMKAGEKGDIAKNIAEIYKGAIEDLKSGRVDSRRVNLLAEMLFSPEQLASWGFDLNRIGQELQSDMLMAMFDPAGDSKKSYGQRFAEYIRKTFGEAADIGVKELGNGRYEFYYDDIEHLAQAVGMSKEVVAAFLDDLDAYGIEVMMSAQDTADLLTEIQKIKDELGSGAGAAEVARKFADYLKEGGKSAFQIGEILEDMRRRGILDISKTDIANIFDEVRDQISTEANENNKLLDVDGAKVDLEDLRKFFEELFKDPVKAQIEPEIKKSENGEDMTATEELAQFKDPVKVEFEMDDDSYKELHDKFVELKGEIGDADTAVEEFVAACAQAGMTPEQISSILNVFRNMGENIAPALTDVQTLIDKIAEIDTMDVEPTIVANTSTAYNAVKNLMADIRAMVSGGFVINGYTNIVTTTTTTSGARSTAASKVTAANIKALNSRAAGGVTGKAGPTLVNELGPELISDKGKAFIANHGQPGFVNLSKNAIVFNAKETKDILHDSGALPRRAYADGTRKGLIGRLLVGRDVPAEANTWVCKICGSRNDSSATRCWSCKNVKGASNTAASIAMQKGTQAAKNTNTTPKTTTKTTTTTTTKTTSTLDNFLNQDKNTAKTQAQTYVQEKKKADWYCPVCGYYNTNGRVQCAGCGYNKSTGTGGSKINVVGQIGKTSTRAGQSYGLEDLFTFGDDGSAGGGSGGGAASESRSNPQKIDWIAVKLNRIQREISDLETVASSGLKKLSTRLDAAKKEASKLNEEIDIAQKGYERYMAEANSIGLSEDLAEKVRNGAIDINEYEDEELRQQIQEFQEWFEKAQECASAVEELNQQIGELYKNNFDLIQTDYANQLAMIEHEMNMINADMQMAQAKGMLDSASYYERLAEREAQNLSMLKSELNSLQRAFSDATHSTVSFANGVEEIIVEEGNLTGSIEAQSEEWYAMIQEINGVEEAIAAANVRLQEYQKTMREIQWSYLDTTMERFSQATKETAFFIELMSNNKLFEDNGRFTGTGTATAGMHALSYNMYMAQAEMYGEEMMEVNRQWNQNRDDVELMRRRNELWELQRESILAAEQEKNAMQSLVSEGIRLELDALKDLCDAYKDNLDAAKDLYDYQQKVSDKTKDIAKIQKQLTAYQGDDSEESRAKVQKLNQELEKAQKSLTETERDKAISEQKQLIDDLYNDYEELLNKRLDDVDQLMRDMIENTNENHDEIMEEIEKVIAEVGYNRSRGTTGSTSTFDTAMESLAYYDKMWEGVSGAKKELDIISANVQAMAQAAGAVKGYAKGGLIDYTGIAAVHGTPANPEMVLSAADTEKFLQAAQMMNLLQNGAVGLGKDIAAAAFSSGGGTNIGEVIFDIAIDHVENYDDFVKQLQADPKFEKFIDTITMGRMLGGSRFAKNSIRF